MAIGGGHGGQYLVLIDHWRISNGETLKVVSESFVIAASRRTTASSNDKGLADHSGSLRC